MQEIDDFEQIKLDILETLDIIDIRLLALQACMENEEQSCENQIGFLKSCFVNLCSTFSKLPSHSQALQLANEISSHIQHAAAGNLILDPSFSKLCLQAIDAFRESFGSDTRKEALISLSEQLHSLENTTSPLANPSSTPKGSSDSFLKTPSRQLKALLVESSSDEQERIKASLNEFKFSFTTADDAAEGILEFSKDPEFDIVLVNLNGGSSVDGNTFIQVIENLFQKRHISRRAKCIVYSDEMTYSLLKSLLQNECVHAVKSAPLEGEALLTTVARALSYRGKLMSFAQQQLGSI